MVIGRVPKPGRCADEEGWTVELTEWHLVGPGLVSLICALNLRLRLSRARIREFLHDWLQVDVCTATINQCIHEAGRAVEPVVTEQIEEAVRQAEVLYADETGWKEHAKRLWLWVFTCATASLFVVGPRTREVVVRVLGEQFAHWLMSDGYGVYRQYDWRLRCLARLIRKARGLEQSLDAEAHRFGQKTLEVLETLMAAVYAAREGTSRGAFETTACRSPARILLGLLRSTPGCRTRENPRVGARVPQRLGYLLGRARLPLAAAHEQRGGTGVASLGHRAAYQLWHPHRTRLARLRADDQRDRNLPQARRFALAVSRRGHQAAAQRTARSGSAAARAVAFRSGSVSDFPCLNPGGTDRLRAVSTTPCDTFAQLQQLLPSNLKSR